MTYDIVVAGSRGFDDYMCLEHVMRVLAQQYGDDIRIISGGARGADALGERYADEWGFPLKRMPADWDKYGKGAGFRRNSDMAKQADVVVVFWDGESRGAKHMIDQALYYKTGLHVFMV